MDLNKGETNLNYKDKQYKAVRFVITKHHAEVIDEKEPWNNEPAYDTTEERYRIIDTETGEIFFLCFKLFIYCHLKKHYKYYNKY